MALLDRLRIRDAKLGVSYGADRLIEDEAGKRLVSTNPTPEGLLCSQGRAEDGPAGANDPLPHIEMLFGIIDGSWFS